MVKLRKRIERLRQRPKNTDSKELISILEALGFECRSAKGSHVLCKHPSICDSLTVPHQRPLKSVYVKKALPIIQLLLEEEDD